MNTVARAYRFLEREGFVAIERRKGVRVAAPAHSADAGRALSLRSRFREMLHHLRQAGVQAEEIHQMVLRELETHPAGSRVGD